MTEYRIIGVSVSTRVGNYRSHENVRTICPLADSKPCACQGQTIPLHLMADDLILAAKDLYKNFADTIGVCLGAGGSLLTQRTNFLPKLLPSSFTLPERLKGHRPSSQTLPTSQCPPLQRDMSIKKMYCLWQNNTCEIQGSAA